MSVAPPAQVDEPVNRPDKHRSSNNVAGRDRYQVPEKIAPGQSREIRCGHTDRSPECIARTGLDEESHRDEENIRDAVFETGGDKRGMQSAAMLIVKKGGGVWLNNDVVLRLQVDDNPEPIVELRRLVERAARQRRR